MSLSNPNRRRLSYKGVYRITYKGRKRDTTIYSAKVSLGHQRQAELGVYSSALEAAIARANFLQRAGDASGEALGKLARTCRAQNVEERKAQRELQRKRRPKGSRVQGGEVKARLRVISREIGAPWVELVLRPCFRATGSECRSTAASSATTSIPPPPPPIQEADDSEEDEVLLL